MKRHFLTLLIFFFSAPALLLANDIDDDLVLVNERDTTLLIDNLYYILHYVDTTAMVTYSRDSNKQYIGEIVIPETVEYGNVVYIVTAIESAAFARSMITHITLSNTIKTIGDSAFYHCDSLETCTMGDTQLPIDSIGRFAFSFSGLKYIYGNRVINKIKSNAFSFCDSLRSIHRNVLFKEIGFQSFFLCFGLSNAPLREGVEKIAEAAFFGCDGFDSIRIPASVNEIGINPFAGIDKLGSIVVDSANTHYDSRGHCNAIIKKSSDELVSGCKTTIIPENCKIIGERAFTRSTLDSIRIPASVQYIGELAFAYGSLSTIIFEGSYHEIKTFYTYLPSGKRLWRLRDIDDTDQTLYIGGSWVDDSRLKYIGFPDSIQNMPDCFLLHINSLTTLSIPLSVKEIDYSAFKNCRALLTMTIPSSVNRIKYNSFEGCNSLTVYTPLDSAEYSAFQYVKEVVYVPDLELPYCLPFEHYMRQSMNEWRKHTPYESDAQWQERINNAKKETEVKEGLIKNYIEANVKRTAPNLQIGRYNANLEYFPITDNNYGSCKVNVPYEEWKEFKTAWKQATKKCSYRIKNNRIEYKEIIITLPNGKTYISHRK